MNQRCIDLSPADQMELDRLACVEVDDDALDGMTDTGRFIAQGTPESLKNRRTHLL